MTIYYLLFIIYYLLLIIESAMGGSPVRVEVFEGIRRRQRLGRDKAGFARGYAATGGLAG